MTAAHRRALERAHDAMTRATLARNDAVRDAVAAGGSLREVGAAVGLSHSAVAKIAKRQPQGVVAQAIADGRLKVGP